MPSEIGPTINVDRDPCYPTASEERGNILTGAKDSYMKARPESGLDRLICAIFEYGTDKTVKAMFDLAS